MAGIGKLIAGTFVFMFALILSFTIIGIIFALPMFTTAFAMWGAGLTQLGLKGARAATSLADKSRR